MSGSAVSATSAGRELIFEMGVRPMSSAVADMRRFADEIIREQNRIHENAKPKQGAGGGGRGGGMSESLRREAAERKQLEREERIEREANVRARMQAERQATAERLAAEKAARREEQRLAQQAERERERALKKRVADEERAARDAANAAKRAAAEQEREEDRIHHRHRLRQLDRARRNRMEREAAATPADPMPNMRAQMGQAAIAAGSGGTASDAIEKQIKAVKELKEEFRQSLDAIVRLGKGFALMGILGEKETEKLIQGLIRIQAAAFIVKGAFQFWTAVTESVKRYREAVIAAQVAERALQADRLRSMVISGRGSGVMTVASSAPALSGMLQSASSTKAQFAGMLQSSTAPVAGGVAGAAGTAALSGTAAAGGGAAAAGGAAGGTGAAAAGGIMVPLGAFVAAIVGATAGLKVLWEFLSGTGDAEGAWSRKINESVWLPLADAVGRLTGWFDLLGNKALEAAEKNRKAVQLDKEFREAKSSVAATGFIQRSRLAEERGGYGVALEALLQGGSNADAYTNEMRRRDSEIADSRSYIANGNFNAAGRAAEEAALARMEGDRYDYMRNASASRGPSADQLKNSGSLREVEGLLTSARGELSNAKGDDARLQITQRITDLEKQRIGLAIEGARLAKDEGRSRLEAGREALRTLEQERRERMDLIKRMQDSVKSARERFGELDPSQRITAIEGKKKLDAAAAAEAAGNQGLADQIRGTVNKSEKDVLRGLGLESVDRGVGKVSELAGKQAGFDQFFGQPEQAKIAQQQAIQSKVDAAIKVQQQLNVQVEIDSNKQAKDIADRVIESVKIYDQKREQEIKQYVDQALQGVIRNDNARRKELKAASG